MSDVKKFLMLGGGLGLVYAGVLILAMDSFATASFILYGNRWTIPVWTACIITMVTAVGGFSSVWWGPIIQDHILEEYGPEEDQE